MVVKRRREPDVQYPSFLSHPISTVKEIYTEINWREHLRLIDPKALVDHPKAVARNRWKRCLPWANNRIHLRGLPYSYINASPISLGDGDHKEHYIACQGPLDSSHMWRMIWEQDVSVVVMLTLPIETGEEKCLRYYPEDEGDIIDSEGFKVALLEKTQDLTTDIRTLKITHEGQERTITHFLFKTWPDHGVPVEADLASLFFIMQRSRDLNKTPKPRIIHCSAGVGRTGTFIVLEHLMQEMECGVFDDFDADADADRKGHARDLKWWKKKDPVFETVDAIRTQRMRMVNETQLMMIYEILKDRWRERGMESIVSVEEGRKRLRKVRVGGKV